MSSQTKEISLLAAAMALKRASAVERALQSVLSWSEYQPYLCAVRSISRALAPWVRAEVRESVVRTR